MKLYIRLILLYLFIVNGVLYSQQYKWHALPNAPVKTARLEDVFFIDAFTGYVVVSATLDENLYKTTDGGASWVDLSDSAISYPRCVSFTNANTGWIGTYIGSWPGYQPGILKTTDGGESWVNQFAAFGDTTMGICGIQALDENHVFACGRWYEPAKFYKTTNGGDNWTVVDLSSFAHRLIDVYFTSPDSGFVTGGLGDTIDTGKGIVLFTSDGGNTWVNKYTTQNNKQWGWKINFPSQSTGYISLERFSSGGGGSYFLKTTDGGSSWQEKLFSNFPFDEEGIGFVNNTTGWIGGWFFNTFKTTNGGLNWVSDPWGYNVNRFRFINDTLGYAVGQTVYKYERDTSVGITTISGNVPDRYELSQNYPNPFNPSTTIEFHVLDYEYTKLSVFDVLGREVSILVNERLRPGIYKYKFDATGLHSGVYFYRVETERYTETKRMILLK